MATNYAHLAGIHTLGAAILFAILYFPLVGIYGFKLAQSVMHVNVMLTLFCTIRFVSFIIRAVLASSASAGENLNLLVADQILFGVGYFALLYTAYTSVLDRESLAKKPPMSLNRVPIITRLLENRNAFRLILTVGVALGITGSVQASDASASDPNAGKTLRIAGTAIFLAMTALQTLQTVRLLFNDIKYGRIHYQEKFGDKHAGAIFLVISILLLIREVFAMATISNSKEATNEYLWYPLQSLPEFLAVCILLTPGLIPSRKFLREAQDARQNSTTTYTNVATDRNPMLHLSSRV